MGSHNFSIKTESKKDVYINPDTFCPCNELTIRLGVCHDPQHDGHGWDIESLAEATNVLVDDIIHELKEKVREYVFKTNPYSIHYFEKVQFSDFEDIIARKDEIFGDEWDDKPEPSGGNECFAYRRKEFELYGQKYTLAESFQCGSYKSKISIWYEKEPKGRKYFAVKNRIIENLFSRSPCKKETIYREPNTKLTKYGFLWKDV